MMYVRFSLATAHVHNYQDARAVWSMHGGPGSLIGSVVVSKPLTPAQRLRLPKALRARLKEGVTD
jgi:hypothetical protein